MGGFFFGMDEFQKCYKCTKILGKGSFATVKVCTKKNDKTCVRAVKIMNLESMKDDSAEALEQEMSILHDLDHPNIVKLYEVFRCKKNVYLVMEIMTGGEMFDRIVAKEQYEESMARREIADIAKALDYCHEKGIVHRDLKPENLLYSSGNDDATVKIADFGLAKVCNEEAIMKTACGTPGYVAPEILNGQIYDSKVDIWSLGVICYILLCGFPPFYHQNNQQLFNQIRGGKYDYPSPYWDNVSKDAKDFIDSLLVVNPVKRLCAKGLLQHKWITGTANSNLTSNLKSLKEYNAKRKFRQAVAGIQALHRMQKSMIGGGGPINLDTMKKETDTENGTKEEASEANKSETETPAEA